MDKLNQFNPRRLEGKHIHQKEMIDSFRDKFNPEEIKELEKLGLDPSNVRFANKEGIEPVRTIREEILETAKSAVTQDRNADYGEPEQNFQTIANYWNVYLLSKFGAAVTIQTVDVAIMMSLVKHARLATSPAKLDNWVDIAGYAACGAECVKENSNASKRQGVSE